MSDVPPVFRDAFASRAPGADEDVYAKADYTTNTLYVHVPANELVEMTLIHAFTSREEFMHGEWNVGIILSCAHLELAGIEALFDALSTPENLRVHVDRLFRAWGTATTLDSALGPFQEAVDKLQILSVVSGDEEYYRNIEQSFERISDGNDAVIADRLDDEIAKQRAFARGETVPGSDGGPPEVYVNPLYYYALLDAALRHGRQSASNSEIDDGLRAVDLSTERTVAEAVARAALDVPNPIAPLGTDAANEFRPLSVGRVETAPLTVSGLRQTYDSRLTKTDYSQYLLAHAETIGDTELRSHLLERFHERGPSWLDAVFVCTLKELDALAETLDRPIAELEQQELRRRLVEAVHGVDPGTETTMLQFPNPLLSVPMTATADAPDHDLVDAAVDPFSKVLLEAFEQHGAFGGVVFSPDGEKLDHVLNHHALDKTLEDHPVVPDDVETYRELWQHYYLGKHLVNELLRRRDDYRESLAERFRAVYDGLGTLANDLDDVDLDPVIVGRSVPADVATRASLDAGEALQENVNDAFEDVDRTARASEPESQTDNGQTGDFLDQYVTAELHQAARELGIDHPEPGEYSYAEVDCPFCDLIARPCGDGHCATAGTRAKLEECLPRLVSELVRCETVYA